MALRVRHSLSAGACACAREVPSRDRSAAGGVQAEAAMMRWGQTHACVSNRSWNTCRNDQVLGQGPTDVSAIMCCRERYCACTTRICALPFHRRQSIAPVHRLRCFLNGTHGKKVRTTINCDTPSQKQDSLAAHLLMTAPCCVMR
jgi:hypothetical protein